MTNFLIRRFFSMILVCIGVATLTFFLAYIVPSDPVRLMLGPKAIPQPLRKCGMNMAWTCRFPFNI